MNRVHLFVALALSACNATTGSALFDFTANAAGPLDAVPGMPLDFMTGFGFHLVLNKATLHLGAVYLATAGNASGAPAGACTLTLDPSAYAAQAFGPIDVDLLSPDPQPFPGPAKALAEETKIGEIWFVGGDAAMPVDINAPTDPQVILHVEGVADQNGTSYPFTADVTINADNRGLPVQNPALPGAEPICKQRILTPIALDVTPSVGGSLLLRIDPRGAAGGAGMFDAIDFSKLDKVSDAPLLYQIPDTKNDTQGKNLFDGLRSNAGVYSFNWTN